MHVSLRPTDLALEVGELGAPSVTEFIYMVGNDKGPRILRRVRGLAHGRECGGCGGCTSSGSGGRGNCVSGKVGVCMIDPPD